MAGKIYTRTGDKGKTSLFDGKRVLKSDKKVEAYGTIDELNSAIGAASAFIKVRSIQEELEEIQNDLLEIGSSLAVSSTLPVDQLSKRPEEFEKLIDKLTKELPALNQFILPGGGKGGSLLHLARTITRRAERRVVGLSKSENIDQTIITYLNRLSDLLFTMARFVNHKENRNGSLRASEKIWRKK
ncbi:MAG: cob(I)yrinic acid a,c-diamide adenosyltransferase [Candidatus Levybacteria bacterium]|nr:cob(I)yrinic acid a,c-diamide adenosyltransferase [Candidatus Levybacteria bacterium]